MVKSLRNSVSFPSRIVKKGNGWYIPIRTEYKELIWDGSEPNDFDIVISIPRRFDE